MYLGWHVSIHRAQEINIWASPCDNHAYPFM